MTVDVARVTAALVASRKYKCIAPAVLERVARDESRGARSDDDAIDHAKRRLHQIFAAFVSSRELDRAQHIVASIESARGAAKAAHPARDDGDPARDAEGEADALRDAARRLLALHASTRERLAALDSLYPKLWSVTGSPRHLLDLGCGFHPFALPWMELAPDAHYHAVDLDSRSLELAARFLRAVDQPHRVESIDLVEPPRLARADVVLAFKLLPTLERQRDGAAARVLDALDARHVVLSFPTASLAHRQRGMRENYDRFARTLVADRGRIVHELEVRGELFRVVELGGAR